MKKSHYLIVGLCGATAVALGAMGAHALKPLMDAKYMAMYEKAVLYHFIHSLAIFGAAILFSHNQHARLITVIRLFLIGIILFSGSLYLLSIREAINMPGLSVVGPVTPIGGLAFIAGWLMLAFGIGKKS